MFATQVPPLFFKDADVPLLVASVVLIIFVTAKTIITSKVLSLANILMVSCVIAVSTYNLFVKCVSNTGISMLLYYY
jgi:hypothetical protein